MPSLWKAEIVPEIVPRRYRSRVVPESTYRPIERVGEATRIFHSLYCGLQALAPRPSGPIPPPPTARRRRQCVRKLLSKEAGIEERKLHRLSHNTLHLQVVRARPNGGGKRKSESRYDA